MSHRAFRFRLLLISIFLFSIPALACDFSFDVAAGVTPTAEPVPPTAIVKASPQSKPTTAVQPTGVIKSVTMALDAQSGSMAPVNPTTEFAPNSVFHAVVAFKDAPKNTKFTATWYAVDVGSAAAPNTKIDSTDVTADGTNNIDFTLTPSVQWPPGTYRVEIYVNGALDQTLNFSVN